MILAANFKMNHTRASTRAYINKLNEIELAPSMRLFLFPPATALDKYESIATIGAQNAYAAKSGSYTGEIGLEQLEEFGIETLLLGHSERRHIFNETQELIAKKFAFYQEQGFEIVYCVGETLEQRETGTTFRSIKHQFDGINTSYEKLIVAYEPVWAIGTGKSAKAEDIEEVLEFVSQITPAPLLYGGSVKRGNIAEILSIAKCDGVLIGSASWNVEQFITMIEIAKEM